MYPTTLLLLAALYALVAGSDESVDQTRLERRLKHGSTYVHRQRQGLDLKEALADLRQGALLHYSHRKPLLEAPKVLATRTETITVVVHPSTAGNAIMTPTTKPASPAPAPAPAAAPPPPPPPAATTPKTTAAATQGSPAAQPTSTSATSSIESYVRPSDARLDAHVTVSNAIAEHNAFRALHEAGPLTWNATMAALAQTWVNKCVFQHSGGSLGPFGENIAAGQATMLEAFQDWTTAGNPSEEAQYNPANPQGSHFTQVVWKATQQLGCAVASCNMPNLNSNGPSLYYACEYWPAGNVGVVGDGGANYRANITP